MGHHWGQENCPKSHIGEKLVYKSLSLEPILYINTSILLYDFKKHTLEFNHSVNQRKIGTLFSLAFYQEMFLFQKSMSGI